MIWYLLALQHILGVTVTHQDMQAIDPDYYKNLLQITELPLEDLGLDLTFSTDTEMFGTFSLDKNRVEAYMYRFCHQ